MRVRWAPVLARAAEIVSSYETGVTLRQLFYQLGLAGLSGGAVVLWVANHPTLTALFTLGSLVVLLAVAGFRLHPTRKRPMSGLANSLMAKQ